MDDCSQNPVLRAYMAGSLWLYCGSSGLQIWLPLPKVPPVSPTALSTRDGIGYSRQSSFPPDPLNSHPVGALAPGYISRRVMLSIELDECVHPLSKFVSTIQPIIPTHLSLSVTAFSSFTLVNIKQFTEGSVVGNQSKDFLYILIYTPVCDG
ncbi:unnamed protein product [Echinostoma caproni]|uniref:Uncharacterized protein n=1 Tax=Echinostoma caproni TaxID=27848 RepID=A0A3P8HQ87_9TREM|nr:unnamed protein product [Echinostoma caproni]